MSAIDASDIQGLVRFGHGHMKQAAYVLVRIKDPAAARRWLTTAPVTSAATTGAKPVTALQIAFTAAGLRALGLAPSVIAGFSPEFLGGMTEPNRSRRLGDMEANAPEHWAWGAADREPHAVIMFFAVANLAVSQQSAQGPDWAAAFEEIQTLPTSDLDGVEPFGFVDGISQPQIDWKQDRDPLQPQIDFTNIAALGEFLLGYPNEYGKYTDRPLLPIDASSDLLPAEDDPGKRDLARNGTYLVLRTLRQDVWNFWHFIRQQTGGDADATERLAWAFVGRQRDGQSLLPPQSEPIPGIDSPDNRFTFDADPGGSRCPFGAHIRRLNPRNTDYPGRPTGLKKLLTTVGFGPREFRDDLMSSVRFHRILRRGREYGPQLTPEAALAASADDGADRGLHFICLNANISRQFEFLQNAWIVNPKFTGLTSESDPLLGTRAAIPGCPATADFTVQKDGELRERITGLPQFVTVRGGAYFFLPSLRALRYFAGLASHP